MWDIIAKRISMSECAFKTTKFLKKVIHRHEIFSNEYWLSFSQDYSNDEVWNLD